ncbi:VOC family protein [Yersinia kristensenii]|uniref:VOC family protein n=1 Tax=Yersinia kristensenii TaxID=28152 RepID=UPI0002D87728|nr:VOC family protein [Yersinia kristensenii]PEH52708.1 glyoxalase/bleomycin resistance/dioxygenase family protein [Yersinia kristensenii]SUP70559.1 prolyl endopeptidase [Yersinia kristensenii]
MSSKPMDLLATGFAQETPVLPQISVMRVARATDNLILISEMYCHGLGFTPLGSFTDHQGFDGAILGHPHHAYHIEFTHHRGTRVGFAPTQDNLLVFYLPDETQWAAQCQQMLAAGFRAVASYNPYWDVSGKTFEDTDGYRVVLQQRAWEL